MQQADVEVPLRCLGIGPHEFSIDGTVRKTAAVDGHTELRQRHALGLAGGEFVHASGQRDGFRYFARRVVVSADEKHGDARAVQAAHLAREPQRVRRRQIRVGRGHSQDDDVLMTHIPVGSEGGQGEAGR